MAKRKAVVDSSSEDEDYNPKRAASSSPDKPLQKSRRAGKKARKVSDRLSYPEYFY